MAGILENILIMILTIIVLIGGGYLALLLLKWGLKLKGTKIEDEGLLELWAEAKKEQQESLDDSDESTSEDLQ